MEPREKKLNLIEISDAFPHTFDFYHLGRVENQPQSESLLDLELEELSATAFKISGDINVLILFLFSKNLDSSTYSELGNVITSQVATQLSKKEDVDILISPPSFLNSNQIKKITQNTSLMIRKTYILFSENSAIPIETIILAGSSEGFGYA